MSFDSINFWSDLLVPAVSAAFGALLVLGPLLFAYRSEKAKRTAMARFHVDAFDYVAHWMAGYLSSGDEIPAAVRSVALDRFQLLQTTNSTEFAQILHSALTEGEGGAGSAADSEKLFHLLAARVEAGLHADNPDRDDVFACKYLSGFMRLLFDPDSASCDLLGGLRLLYEAGQQQPGNEVFYMITTLTDSKPGLRELILAGNTTSAEAEPVAP